MIMFRLKKTHTSFRRLRESDADSRFFIMRRCFFNPSSYNNKNIITKQTRSNISLHSYFHIEVSIDLMSVLVMLQDLLGYSIDVV